MENDLTENVEISCEQRWNQMSFEEIADDIIFNARDGAEQLEWIQRALRNQTLLCADVIRQNSLNPNAATWAIQKSLEELNRLAGDEISNGDR